jgi:hypothetical protein
METLELTHVVVTQEMNITCNWMLKHTLTGLLTISKWMAATQIVISLMMVSKMLVMCNCARVGGKMIGFMAVIV